METTYTEDISNVLSYSDLMKKYKALEEKLQLLDKSYMATVARADRLAGQITDFEVYVTDHHEDFHSTVLEDIVGIFEFELMREERITMTIEAEVVVSLPINLNSADLIADDFEIDITNYDHEVTDVVIGNVSLY